LPHTSRLWPADYESLFVLFVRNPDATNAKPEATTLTKAL